MFSMSSLFKITLPFLAFLPTDEQILFPYQQCVKIKIQF